MTVVGIIVATLQSSLSRLSGIGLVCSCFGGAPSENQRWVIKRCLELLCPAGSQIQDEMRVVNGGSAPRDQIMHACEVHGFIGWHTWDAALSQSRTGSRTGPPFPYSSGSQLEGRVPLVSTPSPPSRGPSLRDTHVCHLFLPILPSPPSTLSLPFVQPRL